MSSSPTNHFLRSLSTWVQASPLAARAVVIALAGILSILLIQGFGSGLRSLEERIGALGWSMNADAVTEERITLVSIDERSLAEVGAWPWPRAEISRLVDALSAAGVQLQLHDIVYPEARQGDAQLLASLENSQSAVLAQIPVFDASGATTGTMSHPMTGVACDAASGGLQLTAVNAYLAPAAGFAAIPKGHIGAVIASDGAVRKTPALVCQGGQAFPALSIAAFLQLGSSTQWSGAIENGSGLLEPAAWLTLDGYPGLDIPLDSQGNLRISYAKAPEAFRAVSAIDVMNGRIDPAMLANTWVLIGGTAFGMADIVPTPYSGAVPGVELQARLLTSLLDMEIPYTPAGATMLLGLLSLVFAAGLMMLPRVGERAVAYGLPAAAVLLPIFSVLMHNYLLASQNIWLGWMQPALFGLLAASSLLILELSKVRLERARVFGNLNSYLPDDIAKDIAFNLPSSAVNAERRDVTLLSADLRNFSAFGEARPPEEIAAVLHYFFTRATQIIERNGGQVQEFQGDSLLAMWEGNGAEPARQSLLAAAEMQGALNDKLLPEHAIQGLEPLALGVGIEQGPVLIGSIGPAHRRSHTMLGDTVSITLRIQEMTAELAQPILVGECAARQLASESLISQGSYLLHGLQIPHTLFAPKAASQTTTVARQSAQNQQPSLTVVSGGKR